MNDAVMWTELVIMPNSPLRDPKALTDVSEHGGHETRSSVIDPKDLDGLHSDIDTAYAKLASCEQATVDHRCVSSARIDGTDDDGVMWSRITLVYDRRCIVHPEKLEDFLHDVATWLNQARARLYANA